MADILKPDLCVIGAGALGTALAMRAAQSGLSVVLVPRPRDAANDPGAGALRRAAFVASAARAQAMRSAGDVALAKAEPKPNFRAVSERAAAIAATVAPRDGHARLAAFGVTLLDGQEASFTGRQSLRCGEVQVRARQFVLATGDQPLIPSLPGLDEVPWFTPDSIADNIRKLSHLVVIGGTPAAFELAQAYRRLGSMVTIVPQGSLLPGFDPELVAVLLRALREEGVTVLDDAEVTAILPRGQGTGVALRRPGGEENLDVSHILLAMGALPDLDSGLLDAAQLRRDRLRPDHLDVRADGQTSNPRIWAIGGAAGVAEPHVAQRQASLLVERLLGRGSGRPDPLGAVRLVQTEPALAQIGQLETEHSLRPGQTVLRSNLAENDAVRAIGGGTGTVRLITDARGGIGAAGAVGTGAGELMGVLALALSRGAVLADLARLALPQPSLAAALVDLADQHLTTRRPAGWAQRLPLLAKMTR